MTQIAAGTYGAAESRWDQGMSGPNPTSPHWRHKNNPARAGREERAELKAINVEDGAPDPAPNTSRVPLVIKLPSQHPALRPRKLAPNQNHINNRRFN